MSGRKLEFPLIIHCGRKQLLMLCCVVEWESGETSWSAPMSPVYSSVCTLLRRQLWSPLDTVTRHQLSQSLIWKIIKIFLCFYPDNFPDNWGLVEKLRSVASVSWLTGEKSCSLSHWLVTPSLLWSQQRTGRALSSFTQHYQHQVTITAKTESN